MTDMAIWLGIAFCLTQSAMFSGLNLALFSISRLRLEIEVAHGNQAAMRVLKLRRDSNFILATVLWGNVSINVLLTLLSNSVMFGISAFLFSTFAITIGGEILPQAYFSRHALRMASLLAPVLRFYQFLLYFITKPTAIMLDWWLGKEGVNYYRERDLRQLIHSSINADETDVDALEGIGALNFLAIDDASISQEGEIIAPETIIRLPADYDPANPFAHYDTAGSGSPELNRQLAALHYRWRIFVDEQGEPLWVIDVFAYLRAVFAAGSGVRPLDYCHKPIVVKNPAMKLGSVISRLKSHTPAQSDAPVPKRVVLLWCSERDGEKRIITGADILGRLLKGIGQYSSISAHPENPEVLKQRSGLA